jgi:hypothetical protein
MARKRKRQKAGSDKSPSSARKTKTRSGFALSRHAASRKRPLPPPHWKQMTAAQKQQRTKAFKLLRFRRDGMSWRDAEEHSGVTIRTAQNYLPRAFFRDSGGRLQVTAYDRYVERLQLPTAHPGKLQIVRARGSHQRSVCGQWLNALQAAGRGDFGPIDAFPRNVFIDGYDLTTDHDEVHRIVEAQAESDRPLEELYALTGTA